MKREAGDQAFLFVRQEYVSFSLAELQDVLLLFIVGTLRSSECYHRHISTFTGWINRPLCDTPLKFVTTSTGLGGLGPS